MLKSITTIKKQRQIYPINENIKNCLKCEALVKSRKQSVVGYGDFNADVMFIGEAPGRYGANITGVPFTKDRSGRLLQEILCQMGFSTSKPESERPDLKRVYITNIVKCNPQKLDGTNRCPTKNEINNCTDYLDLEINIIQPKLIVTLGLPSSKIILKDRTKIIFGEFIEYKNYHVFPLWHPAFIIRGGGYQKINKERYISEFLKIIKFISKLT